MSDDKVTEIKGAKSPKESALNKLREAAAKEWQTKIDAQVKKTLDAIKVAENEKDTLTHLVEESELDKAKIHEIIGIMK